LQIFCQSHFLPFWGKKTVSVLFVKSNLDVVWCVKNRTMNILRDSLLL
jgi:hypothetical protein